MLINEILDYIEINLFEFDYNSFSKFFNYNKYTLMKIFFASTNITIGEYIRSRRLSEAGKRIVNSNSKILEIALDCGYNSAESFSKAYESFNNITPSQSRKLKKFKFIEPLHINTSFPVLDYKKKFIDTVLIGFSKIFNGKPEKRSDNDEKFFISTRKKQEALRLIREPENVDWWEIIYFFNEYKYKVICSVKPSNIKYNYKPLAEISKYNNKFDFSFFPSELSDIIRKFKKYSINGLYAVFKSDEEKFPMKQLNNFTKNVYLNLDYYDLKRDKTRFELLKIHWSGKENINSRYLEIYIPIKN